MTELLGQPKDDPGSVLVRFRLPHVVDAERAAVVGDFNEWSHDADPMERDEEGFVLQRPLARGRAYRFRYLLDGERWENDWAADAYVPNEFGGDDSVVDLTDGSSEGLPDAAMVEEASVTADHPAPGPAKLKRARKKTPARAAKE